MAARQTGLTGIYPVTLLDPSHLSMFYAHALMDSERTASQVLLTQRDGRGLHAPGHLGLYG